MNKITEVANSADVIVNGYAFTREGDKTKVLNLKMPDKATLIDEKDEIVETSMDDVEIDIVLDYYKRNRKYMED